MKPWNPWRKNSHFVLENFFRALDAPGEWFLARDGTLSYLPRPGEDMTKADVVAPVAETPVVAPVGTVAWIAPEQFSGDGDGVDPRVDLHALGLMLYELAAGFHPGGVQGAPHNMVTDTRKVLDAAAAHQDHRVFLERVALARDVGADLNAIRQPDAGDLAQSRVRLLRRGGVHARAHAPLLRAVLQRRALALDGFDLARLAHELIDGRHCCFSI